MVRVLPHDGGGLEPVETRLSLTVEGEVLDSFCSLTGSGFKVYIPSGCSIRELLCGQLGIDAGYLRDRIQTIFLNSKAVDNPDTAIVKAGSTLALSAAMPGLAGATLRKGGCYAPMRSPISHDNRNVGMSLQKPGDVTIKLFNLLQQELGPRLLQRGIRISGEPLAGLLHRRGKSLHSAIVVAELDGEPLELSTLFDTDWTNEEVCLCIASL
jgi:hypothetical protein